MNIKSAVNHFAFKLKNVWKPTDKDVLAINAIMDFVEAKQAAQVQDYQLFAKLYVMVYAQFLKKHKATVFDNVPVKELSKYLETPLPVIIDGFKNRLNESELYTVFDMSSRCEFEHMHISHIESYYKQKGLSGALLQSKVDALVAKRSDSKDSLNVLLDEYPAVKDYLYKGIDVWDYETVEEALKSQINNVINLCD